MMSCKIFSRNIRVHTYYSNVFSFPNLHLILKTSQFMVYFVLIQSLGGEGATSNVQ